MSKFNMRDLLSVFSILMCLIVCVLIVSINPAAGFKPEGHRAIVREALDNFVVKAPDGSELQFSLAAIREIQEADVFVDNWDGSKGIAEWWDARAHCDDERVEECSQRLIDKIDAIRGSGDRVSGIRLRQLLGQGLHTLQDFYAHSNWVNFGPGPAHTEPNLDFGDGIVSAVGPDVMTCQELYPDLLDGAGLSGITTGYFDPKDPSWAPVGKCRHGLSPIPGINKDEAARPFFAEARNVAVLATRDYVKKVIRELKEQYGNDFGPIRKLLNVRGSLGFVIDDTASMGPTLDGVKNSVASIVNRVDDIPLVSPDEYLLVRFGDPDVGTPFVTYNAEELLQQVNAISPSGGGDCPEKSVTGILRAIDAASFGSRIHVFTDASSKDGMLKESVKSAAKAKEIYINFAVTGSCSPIDPVYEEIARDTGGQLVVLENVSSAVENYFDLVEPELTGDFEPLILVSKTLGEASEDFYIPVDSTMTSFVINVSMETKGTILL